MGTGMHGDVLLGCMGTSDCVIIQRKSTVNAMKRVLPDSIYTVFYLEQKSGLVFVI
jgi:hypothetical protein